MQDSMFAGLLFVHSLLRYVVLADVALATVLSALALRSLPEWRPLHKIVTVAAIIAVDLQLLLGVALWFRSPVVTAARTDMGAAMKAPMLRFFTVEHGFMMLVAVIAIHVGYGMAKRAADGARAHKAVAIGFGLGLVLMVAAIPWPMRAQLARPWLSLMP